MAANAADAPAQVRRRKLVQRLDFLAGVAGKLQRDISLDESGLNTLQIGHGATDDAPVFASAQPIGFLRHAQRKKRDALHQRLLPAAESNHCRVSSLRVDLRKEHSK